MDTVNGWGDRLVELPADEDWDQRSFAVYRRSDPDDNPLVRTTRFPIAGDVFARLTMRRFDMQDL